MGGMNQRRYWTRLRKSGVEGRPPRMDESTQMRKAFQLDRALLLVAVALVAVSFNNERSHGNFTEGPSSGSPSSATAFALPVHASALEMLSFSKDFGFRSLAAPHPDQYAAEIRIADGLASGQPSRLTLDGIAPKMSYREVLAILGRPSSIHWDEPGVSFWYAPSKQNVDGSEVYFERGHVVFTLGTELRRDGQSVLSSELGLENPVEYGSSAQIWPELGLVRVGDGLKLGLRDMERPASWSVYINEPREGAPAELYRWTNSLSMQDSWFEGWNKNWSVGHEELGDRAKTTKSYAILCGGYILGFQSPRTLEIFQNLGHHAYATKLTVGAHAKFDAGYAFLEPVTNGWQNVDTFSRVRFAGGKVAEIQVAVVDAALIEALESAERAEVGSQSTR